jgi:hypothetical protein
MSKLEKEVLRNLAKFLNIPKENISELKFITSISFSSNKLIEIEEILKERKFNKLNDLIDESEELDSDLIFIYKIVLLNGKTYFSVFVDPFELYDSMYIKHVVEL